MEVLLRPETLCLCFCFFSGDPFSVKSSVLATKVKTKTKRLLSSDAILPSYRIYINTLTRFPEIYFKVNFKNIFITSNNLASKERFWILSESLKSKDLDH